MANQEHLEILKQGVEVWNRWREKNPDIKPDLSKASLTKIQLSGVELSCTDLSEADLRESDLGGANLAHANLSQVHLAYSNLPNANLSGAGLSQASLLQSNLSGANLSDAFLRGANLQSVNLRGARLDGAILRQVRLRGADLCGAKFSPGIDLTEANLSAAILKKVNLDGAKLNGANLSGAKLYGASLRRANLARADLSGAMLRNADLRAASLNGAILIGTNLNCANLTDCNVYGISAWDLKLKKTIQNNLCITPYVRTRIRLDNLEVAQFVHLLLKNEKLRSVIDTITSKVVLILGRFTKPRKAILDAIRNELRHHDYLPVLFDFDKPASRDIHETVGTLARMAHFVIADITNPRSIPQELVSIVEQLPSLPIQPLLQLGSQPWGMYGHIKRYPWVLEIYKYRNLKSLLGSIGERVIAPAEEKWAELNQKG